MAVSKEKRQQLEAELEGLRKLADLQTFHFVKARQLLYEGLSKVYLWWREASKEEGLLEELYDAYNIQHKQKIQSEINFSPLLRYLWGMDGTVHSNTIDQWSLALNAMQLEVTLNKTHYQTNIQNKLILFIKDKGGITALTGYKPQLIDTPTESKSASKRKADAISAAKLKAKHLMKGKQFFATNAIPLAKFRTAHTLAIGSSDLGLALIRKTSSGYNLLGTLDDEDMLEQAIISSYERNTTEVPNTVRLLTEIIRTQALPHSMRLMSAALADKSKHTHVDEEKGTTEVMKQLKRLLYVANNKQFVLSANRSDCSVVTMATPNFSIIDAEEDVALAVNDRTYIENNVIHTGDIDFYKADATDTIPAIPAVDGETASHKLQIENAETKRFRYIRFYPLSVFQFPPSKTQAVLRSNLQFKPTYTAKLDGSWIVEMNGKFLSKWVGGYGKQIKRAENVVIGFALGRTGITIHYYFKAKGFKLHQLLPFKTTLVTRPINIAAQSKDIIPVLNALVQLEINGAVALQTDGNMLQFEFKTDCASYQIAIPCCLNGKGKRIDTNFASYGGDNGN